MSIAIVWWILPVLLAAEFGAVAYLRRDRYPRFRFSLWAPTVYCALVLGDLLLAAVLTQVFGSGSKEAGAQSSAMLAWALVAALVTLAVGLLTLFFRWVTRTE